MRQKVIGIYNENNNTVVRQINQYLKENPKQSVAMMHNTETEDGTCLIVVFDVTEDTRKKEDSQNG